MKLDRDPLYLPVDQIPPQSPRKTAVRLMEVSTLAIGGSSGLIRFLQGERNEPVPSMIAEGGRFLDTVRKDMSVMRRGVNVWFEEEAGNFYHPGIIIKQSGRSCEQIDRSARLLARDLGEIAENGGKGYTHRRMVSVLRRFIKISDPYVNIALQAAKGRF